MRDNGTPLVLVHGFLANPSADVDFDKLTFLKEISIEFWLHCTNFGNVYSDDKSMDKVKIYLNSFILKVEWLNPYFG